MPIIDKDTTQRFNIDSNMFRVHTTIKDFGYSTICCYCSTRSNERKELIGKPREIEMIICKPCQVKKKEA